MKPKTTINAAGLLMEAGRALHGEEWIGPLACDLGIARHTLWAWKTGKVALSIDHDIFKKTLALLERRSVDADRVARRLKQIIDSHRSA